MYHIRCQYLSSAVLQAKNASNNGAASSSQGAIDDGLLDMLEAKLSVLRFQMKLKEELEALATRLDSVPSSSHQDDSFPDQNIFRDAENAKKARDAANELSVDLKNVTQLYNEFAVPFELWEVCLSNEKSIKLTSSRCSFSMSILNVLVPSLIYCL